MTPQQIEDQLTTAFEGGSTYWISRIVKHKPTGMPEGTFIATYASEYPTAGGVVRIWADDYESDASDGAWALDAGKIAIGIERMEKHYLRHYLDAVRDNGDAGTADVFLQVCLFGEVVFG